MYLYLMNNMFDVNVRWDQAGPAHFAYSLRSHDGDWRQGKADEFGWDAANPLLAVEVRGKNHGSLPAASSFVAVDRPNVECTTLKPAEANGTGFILRFVETQGRRTAATISLPLLAPLASATAVNLVEDDRPEPLAIEGGNRIALKLPPYGVKTIRVVRRSPAAGGNNGPDRAGRFRHGSGPLVERPCGEGCAQPLPRLPRHEARLQAGPAESRRASGGRLVRGPAAVALRRLDQQPLGTGHDLLLPRGGGRPLEPGRPRLARGGRDHHEVERKEHAAAGGRAFQRGARQPDLPLQRGESPLAHQLRVRRPAVTKSTARPSSGFEPSSATRIAVVDGRSVLKGGRDYGQTPIDYRLDDFDHQMYLDTAVEPTTTYYYRVCAVDAAGQKGPFSREVQATTKAADPLAVLAKGITAQSVYAPEFAAELAIDGSPDPFFAWISKPYGGGTKEKPNDVWWAFQFPANRRLSLVGVKIIGDHREGIPLQKNLQVQARLEGSWKTIGRAIGASQKDLVVKWPQPVETDAIRVFVPAADLPHSPRADVDGIVRICELLFLLPDGREAAPLDLFGPSGRAD